MLPETFVDYEETPPEYPLSVVQTIVRVHTRVSDVYSNPIDQLEEQLRLSIEGVRERQEHELINNREFGLLHAAAPSMRTQSRTVRRTQTTWMTCWRWSGSDPPSSSPTARHRRVRPGVHPARCAAAHDQDVRVALPHASGLAGEPEGLPGLSVRLMGINRRAVASYLLTLY